MGSTNPARDPVFKPGDVIEGRYRILREIGSGGMGTVYLTEHVLIKRRLAIKVLHPEFATDADVIDRFMNEARAVGTLGHPNIVESTDMGFARDEMPYIVFEYLEGSALSDEVYRLHGLPFRRALKIAHQIASALEAAHLAGIIHRDLKSDNVFLTHRDEVADHVKVLDFGISQFVEAQQDISAGGGGKRRATTMGTPEFMAPEQVTAPETVDERTDIYALGVVLYEMLAGRTPFVNENDNEALLHKIILEAPPALDRPELPPGLVEMIFEKLLAKDPTKRFQSMKDVKSAFEAFWGATRRDSQPIEPIALDDPALLAAAAAAAERIAAAQPPKVAEPVALPPPPPAKSLGWIFLVLAVLAAGAGGMLMKMSKAVVPRADDATVAALADDAAAIGTAIDTLANETKLRAQGMAGTPMLRAAIVTDAATLEDMVRDGALFKPNGNDVVEVRQVRDGKHIPLLHLPATAKPLEAATDDPQLTQADGQVRIVAGAPVTTGNGDTVGGDVVLSTTVDLAGAAPKLHDHALSARVEGLPKQVELVAPRPTATPADPVTKPIPIKAVKGASLSLIGSVARVMPSDPYKLPAFGSFAAGGLLLLMFLVSRIIHRGRAKGNA
jgi:tRNA A-37 threonylcarbamoyl transferase component Bud32